jgi:hypothetical protein
MMLPPGIPTLEALNTRNLTRVNNVFSSATLQGAFEICNTRPKWSPVKTDHFPIIVKIRMEVPANKFIPRRCFRKTDWEAFVKSLSDKLSALPRPTEITDIATAKAKLAEIDEAINGSIVDHVPLSKPCPHLKRWWTRELTEMCKKVKRLGCASWAMRGLQGHPDHEWFRRARNDYAKAIRETKAKHWTAWLADMDEESI